MIQQLTDHQDKLTQDLNLQLAYTMQENFSQAMNMLHTTDLNSNILPHHQQANNITADSNVTNAQLLTFLQTFQHKVDRLETNSPSTNIATTSTINPKTGKDFKRYCFFMWMLPTLGGTLSYQKVGT